MARLYSNPQQVLRYYVIVNVLKTLFLRHRCPGNLANVYPSVNYVNIVTNGIHFGSVSAASIMEKKGFKTVTIA